jgi:hypothetical protein
MAFDVFSLRGHVVRKYRKYVESFILSSRKSHPCRFAS